MTLLPENLIIINTINWKYVLIGADNLKAAGKLFCIILSLMLLVSVCACDRDTETPEDQIIYYNTDSEPVTLDPQIANDASAKLIIMNVFEGLIRIDADNNAIPGAAQSWEISKDRLMYTFHLRDGLKWNDGTKLTAQDFIYGVQRALMPQTSSPTAETLYCIKNAEKINTGKSDISTLGVFVRDDRTIIFQLEYPDPDFLQLLATAPTMPCNKTFFEKTTGQYGREDDKLLCNGAFYIREDGWAHDEYIYLRKNTEYTGESTPVPAGVNITIGETPADICDSINDGTIDCGAITQADTERAEKLGFNLTGFGDTVWGIAFNNQDDLLKNEDIRRSLLSAVDRNYILKDIPDNCTVTENIIPDSARLDDKKYRDLAGNVAFNPTEFPDKLLAKALKNANVSNITDITILCPDDEKTQSFVNNLIETWNTFSGGYFNKKPVSVSELKDRITQGNFEVVIAPLTVQGNTPLSTLELFETSSKYNTASFKNTEYDTAVEKLKKRQVASEAQNIKDIEQDLLNKGIFYPLFIENRYYVSAGNVKDIIFHPFGAEVDFFHASKTVE